MSAFENFVNLELPRRSTFLTKVITGHDSDPNAAPPPIISGAPLGTWFREETATKWWRRTETVWEDHTPGGGGGVPGGSDTQLQHNDAGAFGGMAGVTWDSGASILGLASTSTLIPSGAGFDSIRIGLNSVASGSLGVAYGRLSTASGSQSVAVGFGSLASKTGTVAIGDSAAATATASVAIGDGAFVGANSGIAIGKNAVITPSGAFNSVAIGDSAQCNNADSAVALGVNSDVLSGHDDAVALGKGAQSTAAGRCTIGTVGAGVNDMELQIGKGFGAFGVVPPGTQPSKISDPTDLPSALSAIADLIDVIEGAGLAANV